MYSARSLALLLCCWLQGCLEALSGAFDVAMRNRVSMRRDNKGQPGSECGCAFSHLLLSAYALLCTGVYASSSSAQAAICGRSGAPDATRAAGHVRSTYSCTDTGPVTHQQRPLHSRRLSCLPMQAVMLLCRWCNELPSSLSLRMDNHEASSQLKLEHLFLLCVAGFSAMSSMEMWRTSHAVDDLA